MKCMKQYKCTEGINGDHRDSVVNVHIAKRLAGERMMAL